MLITLRYADELRQTSGLELPAEGLKGAGVTPKEVELAKRLIEDMSEHWDPSEFHDTYHEDLMRRIGEKIKAGETEMITEPEKGEKTAKQTAQVIDLTALLKKSLEGGRKGRAASNDDEAGDEAAAKPKLAAKRAKPASRTAKAASAAGSKAKPESAAPKPAAPKTLAKRKRA